MVDQYRNNIDSFLHILDHFKIAQDDRNNLFTSKFIFCRFYDKFKLFFNKKNRRVTSRHFLRFIFPGYFSIFLFNSQELCTWKMAKITKWPKWHKFLVIYDFASMDFLHWNALLSNLNELKRKKVYFPGLTLLTRVECTNYTAWNCTACICTKLVIIESLVYKQI